MLIWTMKRILQSGTTPAIHAMAAIRRKSKPNKERLSFSISCDRNGLFESIEYWLDEREYMSREDYKKGTVRPYGFTEYKTIQDFPIRGRSVFLHVRRRKWIDRSTGEIFTYDFDGLTESGSKLSPEFVAFLKEED